MSRFSLPAEFVPDPAPDLRPAQGNLPIAVIGAGPVGLAAAAHLLEHDLEPVILEAGETAGAAVRDWGHVPMFSPWRLNLDRAAVALLERHGWTAPDLEAFPTGRDLVERYLDPLAATPEISTRLRLGLRVTGVARAGAGKVRTTGRGALPFDIRTRDRSGREGRLLARAVIDASGTWGSPGPAGASGLPALGERAAAERIRYGMPDVLGAERTRYAGRRVLVLGSGHSAAGTLIDLAELVRKAPGTRITWALRHKDLARVFGGGSADQLSQRGALGVQLRELVGKGAFRVAAPFAVEEIGREEDGALLVAGEGDGGEPVTIVADELVVATGLRPDLRFLAELRLDLDPALECPRELAPLIDPNVHSCGTVRPHGAAELAQPEPGLFLVGMKSYGRAPTFLLATGHEQVRSVAAHLAGDEAAARRVELRLPETGVCGGPGLRMVDSEGAPDSCGGPKARRAEAVVAVPAARGCRGGPAPTVIDTCCAADAAEGRRWGGLRVFHPGPGGAGAGRHGRLRQRRRVRAPPAAVALTDDGSTEPAATRPGRGVVVTALGVTQILAWGSSYYLPAVLANPIAGGTGWPLPWVVGGLSLGLLAAGLVSPCVGRAIERTGGRPVLALSSVLLAVGLAILALAPSLPVYLVAWVVIGLGMGAGLYDAAFATLGRLYGRHARGATPTSPCSAASRAPSAGP